MKLGPMGVRVAIASIALIPVLVAVAVSLPGRPSAPIPVPAVLVATHHPASSTPVGATPRAVAKSAPARPTPARAVQGDAADDAISREFTLFKNLDDGQATDAIAREFTVFRNTESTEATDAIAREFTLRKVESSESATDAIAREFVVQVQDLIAPKTEITVGPREGGHIAPGPVTFHWVGFDNLTPSGALVYQHRMNKGAWSDWSPATQTTTGALPASGYIFEVRARDANGNVQDPPTSRSFEVDVAPPTTIEIGVRDIAWNAVTVYWRTNEIARGTVRYGLQATNDFRFDKASEPELRLTHEVRLTGLSSKTPYQFKVELTDEAGNTGTSQTLTFTTAHLYDLSVSAEDITFSSPFPADGESITMSAGIRNTGDVQLTAQVDFYDFRTDSGPVLLGTQEVNLKPYTPPRVLTSPAFVVRERTHKPYVVIRTAQDDLPGNNRADKELIVNAQPHNLTFTVPSIDTWPGDRQQFVVLVSNAGSQPHPIENVQVQGIPFITRVSPPPTAPLAPGASTEVVFELNTPAGQGAGPLQGEVVVQGQQAYSQTLLVTVHSGPVARLQVRLVNERTGEGIANGIVVVGNDPRIYGTGAGGYVVGTGGSPLPVAVPIGNAIVYGYASGYMPKAGSVQIVPGSNSLTIELEEGAPLQITQITTTPLTAAQIVERGVNLEDPENFWVYDFVLYMEAGAVRLPNVIVPTTPGYSTSYGGTGASGGGGGAGGGGGTMWFGGTFTENTSTWIVIPGEVRILRQFWDATVTVHNRTTGFEIRDAAATLSVPSGLSLPELFGAPQPITQIFGTIPAGEFRQASWTIRGDYPGDYRLTGHAVGNLMLGTTPIPVNSTLQSETITVASPSLEITFSTPETVQEGLPFQLGIHVRNTSTIDLEFVQVALVSTKLTNCTPQSNSVVDLGPILRNETKTAWFTLTSLVTGTVLNAYLIVTPPPVEPPVTVVPGFVNILSVDDDDPANPKIRFECDDADAMTARIAGREFNLGPLTEGIHEVTLTDLDTVAPGEYELEIVGLFDGIRLSDTARFDSRLIAAPETTGSTMFTIGGSGRTMNYSGSLLVRRWTWSVPGEQYTRMIVGATASFVTNHQGSLRTSRPRLIVTPPAGAIGSGFECLAGGLLLPGGTLTFKCAYQNAKVFTSGGAAFTARLSGHSAGVPWLFGGAPEFQFTLNAP